MDRDLLTIQVSIVPSKSAFNIGQAKQSITTNLTRIQRRCRTYMPKGLVDSGEKIENIKCY